MDSTVHTIDPDYDTVIVLKNDFVNFAGEDAGFEVGYEIYYQVSSRHLQLASPWFKRAMTEAKWSESKRENGKYHIIAHDWDEDAFLMLLNIFHLRTKQVPRVISLEILARVGVLVDYYECGEAIEMFTAMWIKEMKKTAIPSTYCRDLVLWIWIAWIFDLPKHFEDASAVAIKNGKMAMETLELPIPASVSIEIDIRRHQAIELMISELHKLLDNYRSSAYDCPKDSALSHLCGSFMLGALTRELEGWSLLSPRPEIPFDSMSFYELCSKAKNTKRLQWYQRSSSYSSYHEQHGCNLATDVLSVVDQVSAQVAGLSLRHMQEPKDSTTEDS